jgi:transposase
VPAVPSCIIEPIREQFRGLLPRRNADHPLGCHRPRIGDWAVFDKLVQLVVFGVGYRLIADGSCSATTLRRRRDKWIAAGVMPRLEQIARDAYDRFVGLQLSDVAVDGCITKAPCGRRSPAEAP